MPQRSLFPITEILNHVVNMTRMRAVERSIEVVCQPWNEMMAEIDASQVEAALVNLSFNAIDATPEGGRITFEAGPTIPCWRLKLRTRAVRFPSLTF